MSGQSKEELDKIKSIMNGRSFWYALTREGKIVDHDVSSSELVQRTRHLDGLTYVFFDTTELRSYKPKYDDERLKLFVETAFCYRGPFIVRLMFKGRGLSNKGAIIALAKAGFTAEEIAELRDKLSQVVQHVAIRENIRLKPMPENFTKWALAEIDLQYGVQFNKLVMKDFLQSPKI